MTRPVVVDPAAWAATYEAHAHRLTRLAVVLVGAADAHDLVADAVLQAVASPTWAQVEWQGAYLTRTLTNLAQDRRTQRGRRELREQRVASGHERASWDRAVDLERVVLVRDALAGLSATQATVAFLHYWEDLTIKQIATHLGMRLGTTRTHLARAKRSLRVALTPSEGSTR